MRKMCANETDLPAAKGNITIFIHDKSLAEM